MLFRSHHAGVYVLALFYRLGPQVFRDYWSRDHYKREVIISPCVKEQRGPPSETAQISASPGEPRGQFGRVAPRSRLAMPRASYLKASTAEIREAPRVWEQTSVGIPTA